MNRIIDQINNAHKELTDEGIVPSLLILNKEDERRLFVEGDVPALPKNVDAAMWFMKKFKVELLVTQLHTEPEFYGKVRSF